VQRILVVDDLAAIRSQIGSALKVLGAEVVEASDGVEALELLSHDAADVVVTDVRMPRMNGLELLRALRDRDLPVILHSGFQDVEAAVRGVQLGAVDFFSTPMDFERLRKRVGDCLRRGGLTPQTLVGTSPQLERVRALVSRLAGERSPVLISGETGVGKDTVARALHQESPWREGPLIQIPLSASDEPGTAPGEGLAEKVEQARGGAVLLDEISDATQIQQAEIVRLLGQLQADGQAGRPSVWVLATTRQDLTKRVADGRFREDLWYRISGLHIHVPPLRERREDIDALVLYELERLSRERPGAPFHLDEGGCERMRQHSWPGNVIEFQFALRRMAVLAGERRLLDWYDVEEALRIVEFEARPRQKFESRERSKLVEALDSHGWNVSATARALGMSRGRLRGVMDRLGLS
jgi:DNA-binding NtrC family response regulator